MPINHFLVVYDLRAGELLDFTSFGTDVQRALDAYAATEREYGERDDHAGFEIVLLGADSRETLEQTHKRYFTKLETVPF